ncbi:uncharacterized protein LOC34618674 [Cyclospora cayetanensis]|uniref:Uncharacterized protein LOC34618674 n=1 Tax=Cyclospora cayetanensis TaxID=88456 RepID=A0A6P6RS81_9EIME|nr:uncharacterized protein LOC34618674 [Cyclospora cayetanensis]
MACGSSVQVYHEGLLASILETLLFHSAAAHAADAQLPDLVEYCNRKLQKLLLRSAKSATSTAADFGRRSAALEAAPLAAAKRTPEDLSDLQERQESEASFAAEMCALTLLRFIFDNRKSLQMTIMTLMLDQYDVLLTLIALLEHQPWRRQTSTGEHEVYEEQQVATVVCLIAASGVDDAEGHRGDVDKHQWGSFAASLAAADAVAAFFSWKTVERGDVRISKAEAQVSPRAFVAPDGLLCCFVADAAADEAVWLTIYGLIMDPDCRQRCVAGDRGAAAADAGVTSQLAAASGEGPFYGHLRWGAQQISTARVSQLGKSSRCRTVCECYCLQLRRHLNEVLYDQIPPLRDLHRYLEQPEMREHLLQEHSHEWEALAATARRHLCSNRTEDQQQALRGIADVIQAKIEMVIAKCRRCGRKVCHTLPRNDSGQRKAASSCLFYWPHKKPAGTACSLVSTGLELWGQGGCGASGSQAHRDMWLAGVANCALKSCPIATLGATYG